MYIKLPFWKLNLEINYNNINEVQKKMVVPRAKSMLKKAFTVLEFGGICSKAKMAFESYSKLRVFEHFSIILFD